ncbi:LysE family translocator, partial [Rhizobiaceae sp. 2RAB30]
MLFIASQALSGGGPAGLRATAGVCLGYVVHSLLFAAGVAAIVAASPLLFEGLRWFGVAYLAWLAFQLVRSALRPGGLDLPRTEANGELGRGLMTALLIPKG